MKPALQAMVDGLKARYRPRSVDKRITYYLSLGDDEGEKWTVVLTPDACEVTPGKVANADCVLKTSADLFTKMVNGTHKAAPMDFMNAKIKTNDIGLLQRLQQAFGF